MFRLIKLAFYALIGYALYELYQGMMAERSNTGRGGGGGRRTVGGMSGGGSQARSFGDATATAIHNLTGAGEGQREETQDSDGGSVGHRVGRGVTST
jgi:hypothetical protein